VKAVSLLAVFLAAKICMAWGHAPQVTGWTALAYTWQDVAVAVGFGVVEVSLRHTRAVQWLYWTLSVYAALNIPVERALSTPVTWPMLRAAGGPLADSFKVYLTVANIVLVLLTLALAALLPRLLDRVPPRAMGLATGWAAAVVLLGPMAANRVDTHGMGRNPVVALIESGLPRLTARAGSNDWRTTRFDTDKNTDGNDDAEDLSRFAGTAKGRNVVMVSLESTAAQYLSLYGGKYDVMPNLNALASGALVFDNAYAVYPESIKGLFSVLCSVFPSFDSEPEAYEQAPCRALPATLAAEGYRTGLFHSGLFGYLGMESIIRNRGYQAMEDAGDIGGNHHSSFGVDEPVTVRRMLAWIDALPRGQRFFLTYLPIAGHHPYATPQPGPFAGPEEIDQYRDALHYGDVSLGALRDGLRARGLENNTVWVVYGDHGEAFGQHQGNYAHTFFLYEENVHVPFLIAAPGLMPGQKRVSKVVSLVDTAPTILSLLGLAQPAGFQGRTMLDAARRMALFFTDYSLGILGLRDGPWKFTYEIESDRPKLFDLRSDSQEVTDLARENGARALWYRNLLRQWSSAQKAWIAQATR
jgi:arylsulfatase A-like enzyme